MQAVAGKRIISCPFGDRQKIKQTMYIKEV
jgi:hypothetical protein